jgi:hypothetical protein
MLHVDKLCNCEFYFRIGKKALPSKWLVTAGFPQGENFLIFNRILQFSNQLIQGCVVTSLLSESICQCQLLPAQKVFEEKSSLTGK